jgi:hypothetical protein
MSSHIEHNPDYLVIFSKDKCDTNALGSLLTAVRPTTVTFRPTPTLIRGIRTMDSRTNSIVRPSATPKHGDGDAPGSRYDFETNTQGHEELH